MRARVCTSAAAVFRFCLATADLSDLFMSTSSVNMAKDPWGCEVTAEGDQFDSNGETRNFDDNFDFHQFHPLSDSDNYLRSLEKRLNNLKGKTKEPTSREFVKWFSQVREDYVSHLVCANPLDAQQEAFGDAYDSTENGAILTAVSFMERKLFPEKQALSHEELQHLLEADILAKTSAELASADDSAVTNKEQEDETCR